MASDNTVKRLRELAYLDGKRDAVVVCMQFISESCDPASQTVAQAIRSRITKLKPRYKA